MKKLDVKSFVTIAFTLTLIALLIIVVLFKSEDMFNTVFLLFTNLCTAVFTYFFTKKKEEQTYMEPEPITTNAIGFQQPEQE